MRNKNPPSSEAVFTMSSHAHGSPGHDDTVVVARERTSLPHHALASDVRCSDGISGIKKSGGSLVVGAHQEA